MPLPETRTGIPLRSIPAGDGLDGGKTTSMDMDKFFSAFSVILKPIKSVFGLYLLMYSLPILIPLYIAFSIRNVLISQSGEMSIPVSMVLVGCAIVVITWTIFFLIYFTKQRTKNPELYEKGFLSEFKVGSANHDK